MERLLNINRPEGFPLCAETLQVLNDNSEMLAEWLMHLPLKNRQAVSFGNHLLVCQNLQKRWVKLGAVSAASVSRCKLVFHDAVNHSVQDGDGNVIEGVWRTETADIVDEDTPGLQWTLLGLQHVFELKLWHDCLPSFEAGLSGSSISNGSFIEPVTLYDQENILRGNTERTQLRLAFTYTIRATLDSVLSVPMPSECPDGTRMEADLEVVSTGAHYPVRAYVNGGMLLIDIGRWLKDEIGWHPSAIDWIQCQGIVRINKEVLL